MDLAYLKCVFFFYISGYCPGENKLLTKLMLSLTCTWSCPACEVIPPPLPSSEHAMITKKASVMDNSLKAFWEDLKKEFATTGQLSLALSQLRAEIKREIFTHASAIASRVSHIENSFQYACFV